MNLVNIYSAAISRDVASQTEQALRDLGLTEADAHLYVIERRPGEIGYPFTPLRVRRLRDDELADINP